MQKTCQILITTKHSKLFCKKHLSIHTMSINVNFNFKTVENYPAILLKWRIIFPVSLAWCFKIGKEMIKFKSRAVFY